MKKNLLFLVVLFTTLFASCKSDEKTGITIDPPVFTMIAADKISSNSANLISEFDEIGLIYTAGFAYKEESGDAGYVDVPASSGIDGVTRLKLSDLKPSVLYRYYCYINIGSERFDSMSKTFTTLASGGGEGGGTGSEQEYSGCMEMPAVDYGTTSTFKETYGGETGFKHTVNGNNNHVVITHVVKEGGELRRNYTVLFDTEKKAPLWTASVMHKGYFPKVNGVDRSDAWALDPAVDAAHQLGDKSYGMGSNTYVRGHMVASGERLTSDVCNEQTFYTTNIAPQWHNSFNSGIWSTLEGKTQDDWSPSAGSTDTLYMVTGTVYKKDLGETTNGSIKIPSHFYKVLLKCKFSGTAVTSAQGIGFYYENKAHSGASYSSSEYIKPIDWVETETGFDFFANLPEGVEEAVEKNTNFAAFNGF